LSLVVEPRLSGATRWYVTADPNEIDGLEYAYLAGGGGTAGREQVKLGCGWRRGARHPRLWRRFHRLARLVPERGGVMTDLTQLEAWRDALLRARYAGVRTVEVEGRRVSYATDAEMATALADLERRIAAAQSSRVSQVRIQSTKGV
jgi:hypothetical protein